MLQSRLIYQFSLPLNYLQFTYFLHLASNLGGNISLQSTWLLHSSIQRKLREHFEGTGVSKFSESATKDSRLNQLEQRQKARTVPLHVRKQQAIQLINQKEQSNQR